MFFQESQETRNPRFWAVCFFVRRKIFLKFIFVFLHFLKFFFIFFKKAFYFGAKWYEQPDEHFCSEIFFFGARKHFSKNIFVKIKLFLCFSQKCKTRKKVPGNAIPASEPSIWERNKIFLGFYLLRAGRKNKIFFIFYFFYFFSKNHKNIFLKKVW